MPLKAALRIVGLFRFTNGTACLPESAGRAEADPVDANRQIPSLGVAETSG